MKQTYAALQSAKAKHRDLVKQHGRMVDLAEKNSAVAASLGAQFDNAEAAHRTCEKQYVRELASAGELAAAKKLMGDLRDKSVEAGRVSELSQEAVLEMELEISKSRGFVNDALTGYCSAVQNDISQSLGADRNIREKLMHIYAAMASSGAGWNSTWAPFLARIFTQPTYEEIQAATTEFDAKHKVL